MFVNEKNNYHYIIVSLLFLLIMTADLFQIQDKYNLSLFFSVIALYFIKPIPFQQWTLIDKILCIITLFDIISCFYGVCVIPSIYNAQLSISYYVLYLLLRKIFITEKNNFIILIGSYFPISVALFLFFCSFFILQNSAIKAGFEDSYHLRILLHPLGYIINQWVEILLVILGWVFLIRRYSSIFIFVIFLAIFFSFSRSGYIALFMFTILGIINLRKQRITLLTTLVSSFIIAVIFFNNEVQTTLNINKTYSQKQSIEARINSTSLILDNLKESSSSQLFWGAGNGSYSLITDNLNQNTSKSSTIIAPNLIIQLIVEKGIIGLFLFVILILFILIYIWKHYSDSDVRTIFCILITCGLKELSQASLFNVPFLWLIFYSLLAYLQKREMIVDAKNTNVTQYSVFIIISILSIIFCIFNYYKALSNQSFTYLKQNKIRESVIEIERTACKIPFLIHRGILYDKCYQKTRDNLYAKAAITYYVKATRLQPNDVQLTYLLGKFYLSVGNLAKAKSIGIKLTQLYPKNSLYLLLLSKILYQEGRKDQSVLYLTEAILYMPRLLNTNYILELQNLDSIYFNKLSKNLLSLQINKQTPIEYAHLGYINYWFGKILISNSYLKKAVESLPNLSIPWLLLGDEKKYQLLSYGTLKVEKRYLNRQIITEEDLFYQLYNGKFKMWYGVDLGLK